MTLATEAYLPGRVSVEVETCVPGRQPNDNTLMLAFPLKSFDIDGDANNETEGPRWWIPGTRPKLEVVNRTTRHATMAEDMQVATAFATNCEDFERMLLLKEPIPAVEQSEVPAKVEELQDSPEKGDPGVRGKFKYRPTCAENEQAPWLFRHFNDQQLADPNMVPVKNGRK